MYMGVGCWDDDRVDQCVLRVSECGFVCMYEDS